MDSPNLTSNVKENYTEEASSFEFLSISVDNCEFYMSNMFRSNINHNHNKHQP